MNLKVDIKRIYLAMAEKGYSGTDLAKKSNVSVQAVNNVLNGKRKGTTKVLGNICKALDLPIKEVLSVED